MARKKEPPTPPRQEWKLADTIRLQIPGVPGAQYAILETANLVIANGGTNSSSVEVGNPSELGLLVPTITSATITIQVSNDDTNFFPLKDKDGTALLIMAASTGAYVIDGNALGGILPYRYFRAVSGAAQGAARTLVAFRKLTRSDPLS